MIKILSILAVAAAAFATGVVALAAKPPAETFVAVLNIADEIPHCNAATNAANGHFIAHVVDQATGTVEWKLVANNLPGNITAAHIHLAPVGVSGPVVQALPPTPGEENGVIGSGTFSNPALVAAMQANAGNYYVNVHTNSCPPGVVRDQLNDHGPSNN